MASTGGVYRKYTFRRAKRKRVAALMFSSADISKDRDVQIETLIEGSTAFSIEFESLEPEAALVTTDKLTQIESIAEVSKSSQLVRVETLVNVLKALSIEIEALNDTFSNPEEPRSIEFESESGVENDLAILIEAMGVISGSRILQFETGNEAGDFIGTGPGAGAGGSLTDLTNITSVVM